MGLIWEKSFLVFFCLTIIIGGGAAWATGRALALKWRPFREVIIYSCLLGIVDRFLHWGLFLDQPLDVYKGDIASFHYYVVDTAVLIALASVAYRLTQTSLMAAQYPWLYRKTGPFTWTEREDTPD